MKKNYELVKSHKTTNRWLKGKIFFRNLHLLQGVTTRKHTLAVCRIIKDE